MQIDFTIDLWEEGDQYVAYAPQLDLSSCGKTAEQAKQNLSEAVEGFLEAAQEMNTLKPILEEAGFLLDKSWKSPAIQSERMTLAF